jgi:tRNA(fMet)-specific endonuclease VapC
MRYLLDTNVISELVAKQPNARVLAWLDSTDDSQVYLSTITIGEIKKGIEKLPDSPRKEQLRLWLEHDLLDRFSGRIIAIDINIMLTWGELTANLEKKGRKLPAIDSLVATAALHGHFHLVTRNESDFQDTGVTLFNPWS